jgi:hypothetical protein
MLVRQSEATMLTPPRCKHCQKRVEHNHADETGRRIELCTWCLAISLAKERTKGYQEDEVGA